MIPDPRKCLSNPSPVSAQAMSECSLIANQNPISDVPKPCVSGHVYIVPKIFHFSADTLLVVFKKSLSYNRSEYKGVKLYVRFKLYIRY